MQTLIMDRHKGKQLVIRVPPRHHEALRKVAEKHRRTMTEQIKIALEEHFQKEGIWPDPQAPKPRE